MKYIRTKAGEIYNIDDLYICDELNDKPYGVKNSSWVIYKESIIKQANTIEELCDEVCETFEVIDKKKFYAYMKNEPLYVKKHFEKPIVQKYEILKEYPREHLIKMFHEKDNELGIKTIIYGAIWTDKGLIYVAKMNDKGELELL